MKHGMRKLFDYLVNFYFIYFLLHVEVSVFNVFLLIAVLIFFVSDDK